MAIINTLKKCLDSPYLFADEAAPGRVAGLLAFAAGRLDAATRLHRSGQADQTDVGLFGYEAMFACLRALVYAKGYREAGLRCLLIACEQFYVRTGQLDAEHVLAFERAQSLKSDPAQVLQAAIALDLRTRELLGR
jgi:uncharacterized protein (UPF0332 family)